MGFGYKTEWIAVRDRPIAEVADALRLAQREMLGWEEGTEHAYTSGVYVASPVPGWTLAHGRLDLADAVGSREEAFPDWLGQLSQTLGDIQYFCSERVSDIYTWGHAVDGRLLRACHWVEGWPEVCTGEPTEDEVPLGLSLRSPAEWDEFTQEQRGFSRPDEECVLAIADGWGVNPAEIDDASVKAVGIYGFPPESPQTAKLKGALARLKAWKR